MAIGVMMAVGDIAQIQQPFTTSGITGQMAWAFRSLSAAPDWRQLLVDEYADTCASLLTNVMSVDGGLYDPECFDIIPGTGDMVTGVLTHGADGVLSERPHPPQVCAIISWSAGGTGRMQRGRTFVGGLGRSTVSADQIFLESFAKVALEDFAFQMMDEFGPAGASSVAEIGVISRQEDHIVRPVPLFFAYVSVQVRYQIGTQRRRVHRAF